MKSPSLKTKFLESKTQKILLFILLFAVFLSMYLLNRLYPLAGEDWVYVMLWGTDDRVKSISDILISQCKHYMTWGGRSVAHTIAQFLLMIGSGWHDFLNTIVYVFLVYVVYKISNYGNTINAKIFLLIALALWAFPPAFTTNTLWITYSSVYLWTTVIILLFMYPYYRYYRAEGNRNNVSMSVIIFSLGILAGWTNENMAVALVGFIVLLIAVLKYNRIRIPIWMWFGLAGAIIGTVLLILAPGNFSRMTAHIPSASYDPVMRIARLAKNYIYYLLMLSVLYAALLLYFYKRIDTLHKQKIIFSSLLFFLYAYMAWFVMIASPIFPDRTMFGPVIFVITAIGILYANITFRDTFFKTINTTVLIGLTVYSIYSYYDIYKYTEYLNGIWKDREIFLLGQKSKGIEEIIFTDPIVYKDGYIVHELQESPDGWPNAAYAKYYGVKSVSLQVNR